MQVGVSSRERGRWFPFNEAERSSFERVLILTNQALVAGKWYFNIRTAGQ
jgi:hypothetical protein